MTGLNDGLALPSDKTETNIYFGFHFFGSPPIGDDFKTANADARFGQDPASLRGKSFTMLILEVYNDKILSFNIITCNKCIVTFTSCALKWSRYVTNRSGPNI